MLRQTDRSVKLRAMKRFLSVLFAAEAACAGTMRVDIASPADAAQELSSLVASGAGVLMPGAEPLFRDCGAVLFDDSDSSWPFAFKAGLVPTLSICDTTNGVPVELFNSSERPLLFQFEYCSPMMGIERIRPESVQ